jgi:DNA (cytosine-5)-methyltransferase 1
MGGVEVTAVEYNKDIAAIYQDLYPNDSVIVGDAHEYLLEHHKEFDYIWASPPCVTHSDIRRCGVHAGQYDALYPDMKLYQEIIFLQNFAPKNCKWVIENVRPYYPPLIKPTAELNRHLFWSNCRINQVDIKDNRTKHQNINNNCVVYGVSLDKYKIGNKRQILRNMVNPELGLYIFEQMQNKPTKLEAGLFGYIGESA